MVGGAGGDALGGGPGADSVRFAALSEAVDRILAVSVADDTVEVSALGFGGGLGRLFWDADGAGVAARVLVASVTGLPGLSAADVQVIG